MIILTEQTKNGRIKLFADGESVASFESAYWYSLGLYDGDEISGERLDEIVRESALRRAYNAAISLLSYRQHSKKELLGKLRRKEYDPEACEYAIERAEELGLLDDEAYALQFAGTLIERKGCAPGRIRFELMQKGIEREIIENVLESLDFEPVTRIIELLNTDYRLSPGGAQGRQKTFAALSRLGYHSDDIKSAFREIGIGSDIFDD